MQDLADNHRPLSSDQVTFQPVDILGALWRSRNVILASMLLFTLTAGAVLALLFFAVPRQQIFSHAVTFKFPGVERMEYPNKLAFAISDLASPIVLSTVYEKNNLSGFGIDRAEFLSSISVVPYTPLIDQINARFRDRLSDRKLSFVEREQIEKQQAETLEKEARVGAIIRFFHDGRTPLEKSFGDKIVNDVSTEWADYMVSRIGVLQAIDIVSERPVVEVDKFKSDNDVLNMTILAASVARVETTLRAVRKIPGVYTATASDSGRNAAALELELEQFEVQILLRPRTSEAYNAYVDRRIAFLEAEKQAHLSKSAVVQTALSNYSETQASVGETPPGSPATGSAIPQFDAGYVSKIISLSEKAFNQPYRQNLTNRGIDHSSHAADVDADLQRFRLLAKAGNANKGDPADAQKQFLAAAEQLNGIGAELYKIATTVSSEEVSHRRLLYADSPLPSAVAYSDGHPLLNSWTLMSFIVGILGAGLLAAAIGTAWNLLRGPFESP